MASAYRAGGHTVDPYNFEWGGVVGDRIRRLRLQRGLSLLEFSRSIRKVGGGCYSVPYLSRLERGRARAPLFVYIQIADELEVDAGVLLGPDQASLDVTDAERTLLLCFRDLGIAPHDVLTTMVTAKQEAQHAPPDPVGELAAALRQLLRPLDSDD